MTGRQPDEAALAFMEAGRKLTEGDIRRENFFGPSLEESWLEESWLEESWSRPTALESLPAETAADPVLAAALADFLPPDLRPEGRTADLQPPPGSPTGSPVGLQSWGFQTSAAPISAASRDDPLRGLTGPEPDLLRDFQGRAAALLAGAALAGAARLDDGLLYARDLADRAIERTDGADFEITAEALRLPRRADRVLVLGFIRRPALLPPSLAGPPPGGWPDWPGQLAATRRIADFLIARGYLALPAAGGLLRPGGYGVKAGLGELGRTGLLITPEYGPNIRFLTIITDYPFSLGRPGRFGAADYCGTCRRCLSECPAGALAEGPARPDLQPWPVNAGACLERFRREPCHICLEVCPYVREPLAAFPAGPAKNY